jgi:hypothetical protein
MANFAQPCAQQTVRKISFIVKELKMIMGVLEQMNVYIQMMYLITPVRDVHRVAQLTAYQVSYIVTVQLTSMVALNPTHVLKASKTMSGVKLVHHFVQLNVA